MAQILGPQLIPGFPDEITDIILLHLSLQDLTSLYLVSDAWQKHTKDDDTMRKRMFRLPKQLDSADSATREKFVANLWATTESKVPDDGWIGDLWDHIEINPFINAGECQAKSYDGYPLHPVPYGEYRILTRIFSDISMIPRVPPFQRQYLQRLWRSTFVTYPPVIRVVYNFTSPAALDYNRIRSYLI